MPLARPSAKSIVEAVATLSVLGSLLLVILELAANERAVRSATASDVALSLGQYYANVGLYGQAGKLFRRGMREPAELTEEELADFIFLLHGGVLLYQNAFVLGQEGTLDQSLRTVTLETLSSIVSTPGFKVYWSQRHSVFTQEFQDYVLELESHAPSALHRLYE